MTKSNFWRWIVIAKYSNCNPYDGGQVPPCSEFLGNVNPIIKDGKIIYRNQNKIYCFLSTSPTPSSPQDNTDNNTSTNKTNNMITENPSIYMNLQISLTTFIIGLFINKIQLGIIKYDEKIEIHSDKPANNLIHKILKEEPEVKMDCTPQLSLVISNSNAIIPLFTYTINITSLNFYTLFLLNRLEGDPGLFFGNNSYTTDAPINFDLSSIDIWFESE